MIRPLAGRLGLAVDLVPRTVATWAEAVEHAIVASPTIRACGIELRPSHPNGSETRIRQWRGATTTSAPVEALLDFLVQALAARSSQLATTWPTEGQRRTSANTRTQLQPPKHQHPHPAAAVPPAADRANRNKAPNQQADRSCAIHARSPARRIRQHRTNNSQPAPAISRTRPTWPAGDILHSIDAIPLCLRLNQPESLLAVRLSPAPVTTSASGLATRPRHAFIFTCPVRVEVAVDRSLEVAFAK